MFRIGILARPGRELTIARTEVHRNPFFHVKSYTNAFRAAQALKEQEYDALVMICDEFSTTQTEVVSQIKNRFPDLPLVILTTYSDFGLKSHIVKFPKTIVLDAKSEMKDTPGVLIKMLNNQAVHNRNTKRYKTNQSASLHSATSQDIHPSWLFNLATNGAQLRVFGKDVRKGDKVNLKIFLPELKKEHQVEGVVIWASKNKHETDGGLKNSQMVGVRFLR